ncbi:hypothetical protein D9M71_737980 [compost metagenome]
MSRVIMVCRHCGSENVLKDAWVSWNTDAQDWELECVLDHTYCEDCEKEDCVEARPLEDDES